MLIDPRLMIEFAVIAEERSFTKASERLRVAQPWLSARLKKLEDLVGFQLLSRSTRSVTLTRRGSDFLVAAKSVADATATANALVFQLRRAETGKVRVGAAPYTKFISERRAIIDSFAALRTDLTLEIETGWTLALVDRLADGQLDLSFVMGRVDADLFEAIPLRFFGVALTMSRDHALAGHAMIDPSELRGSSIRCFTRSLNPGLFDILYAPLIEGGANLAHDPEMAEGPPDVMLSTDELAAFFDFGKGAPTASGVRRVPIASTASVPFSLVRRRNGSEAIGGAFWNIASAMAAR